MIPQRESVLNRLNDNLINWNFIEEVLVEDNTVVIYFVSGRKKIINGSDVAKCMVDLIRIFPNIMDKDVRDKMKFAAKNAGKKTDIVDPVETTKIKTDIRE
jgi:hypothetical protein